MYTSNYAGYQSRMSAPGPQSELNRAGESVEKAINDAADMLEDSYPDIFYAETDIFSLPWIKKRSW